MRLTAAEAAQIAATAAACKVPQNITAKIEWASNQARFSLFFPKTELGYEEKFLLEMAGYSVKESDGRGLSDTDEAGFIVDWRSKR